MLLCTDLHGGSILAAQRAPWLVIDPKPYLGDPAYDVLQHMLNCEDRLAADLAGLPKRMADLAGIDADRVREWLFARSVRLGVSHAGRDGRRDCCRQSRWREMDGVGNSPTAAQLTARSAGSAP